MPTDKPRINVTLNKELEGVISSLAERDDVSKSTMARRLIEMAIEYDEDYHFSKLAMERDTDDAVRVSHEDFWNEALSD